MCSYWLRIWRPIKKTPYVILYWFSFKIILCINSVVQYLSANVALVLNFRIRKLFGETKVKKNVRCIQLFAFKYKPQTFLRVCLRFITSRLPFKVYCLKIIKTEPVYPCKKRSLTSFVAIVSFENLYKLLLHKVGMFRIKIDKTCIKTWHNMTVTATEPLGFAF